ncbi:hypothetical protein ACU4GD_26195 [Cupriavidus basilensis]
MPRGWPEHVLLSVFGTGGLLAACGGDDGQQRRPPLRHPRRHRHPRQRSRSTTRSALPRWRTR